MGDLDELDLDILRGVAEGTVTEIPEEHVDSGHSAWLLQQGYIKQDGGLVVLTAKGRGAIGEKAETTRSD